MPNVTFYMSARPVLPEDKLGALSRDCVELCTDVLDAALRNVHVIFVDARHGHGHPVFVDVQYRLEASRTPSVMNQFMEALDSAIVRHTGITARIRCFGYAASSIHARN